MDENIYFQVGTQAMAVILLVVAWKICRKSNDCIRKTRDLFELKEEISLYVYVVMIELVMVIVLPQACLLPYRVKQQHGKWQGSDNDTHKPTRWLERESISHQRENYVLTYNLIHNWIDLVLAITAIYFTVWRVIQRGLIFEVKKSDETNERHYGNDPKIPKSVGRYIFCLSKKWKRESNSSDEKEQSGSDSDNVRADTGCKYLPCGEERSKKMDHVRDQLRCKKGFEFLITRCDGLELFANHMVSENSVENLLFLVHYLKLKQFMAFFQLFLYDTSKKKINLYTYMCIRNIWWFPLGAFDNTIRTTWHVKKKKKNANVRILNKNTYGWILPFCQNTLRSHRFHHQMQHRNERCRFLVRPTLQNSGTSTFHLSLYSRMSNHTHPQQRRPRPTVVTLTNTFTTTATATAIATMTTTTGTGTGTGTGTATTTINTTILNNNNSNPMTNSGNPNNNKIGQPSDGTHDSIGPTTRSSLWSWWNRHSLKSTTNTNRSDAQAPLGESAATRLNAHGDGDGDDDGNGDGDGDGGNNGVRAEDVALTNYILIMRTLDSFDENCCYYDRQDFLELFVICSMSSSQSNVANLGLSVPSLLYEQIDTLFKRQ
ncbi:hypothetical protein RFI_20476, partial [Reticulomyxa filosa]